MIKLTQYQSAENLIEFEKPETLGEVRSWSYSALKVYEECPYRTYISRVKVSKNRQARLLIVAHKSTNMLKTMSMALW